MHRGSPSSTAPAHPGCWLCLSLPGGMGTSGLSCPRGSQRGSQRRGRAACGTRRAQPGLLPLLPLPGVSPRFLLAVLAWEAGGTAACQGCGAERRSSAGLCPPCRSRCPGHDPSLSPAMELPSACSHPGWSVLALVLGLLLWARRRQGWDPRKCPTDLTGKTVIVTGANSGEMVLGAWGAAEPGARGRRMSGCHAGGRGDAGQGRGAVGPRMATGLGCRRTPLSSCRPCSGGTNGPRRGWQPVPRVCRLCPRCLRALHHAHHRPRACGPAARRHPLPGSCSPSPGSGQLLRLDSVPAGLMTDSQGHPGASCPSGPPRCQPPPALPRLEAAPARHGAATGPRVGSVTTSVLRAPGEP